MTENTIVYKVKDIQAILGIGKNQAYKLVKSGEFPYRKIGSTYLIPKAGFDKWLNQTRVDFHQASSRKWDKIPA